MSIVSVKPRLIRLAIVAVSGAAAVSMPACSTSNNQNVRQPSPSARPTSVVPKPTPPPVGHDYIEGLIRSVSDNTIQLTQRDRTAATVGFSPHTMVTELTSGKLSDVAPGTCVDVRAAPESQPAGGAITAESVEISPAVGGSCPPPREPPSAPSTGQPAGVYGRVTSVAGNTFAVIKTDPTGKTTHNNVTVTNTTTYTKHTVTNTQALQQGKCMAAQGTTTGGVLQAATIDLEPCPPMGRPHHHFHLPHLPHFPHHHH
jgi:Domain of unknown function (DUF5666)